MSHKYTKNGKLLPLIDGIVVSPHKFLGGTSTAGILVLKKQVYDKEIPPTHGGGGTVDFVAPDDADRQKPNVV